MPFYAGTNHILQPNPILCIPDFRQSTNPQISVKAQPHADLLSTSFRFRAFLQFILHPNRLSTGLQGTSACAMALICVHRAPRTPPDSTPGHIRSRDGINLCPSSDPNPSRQHSKAYRLERWFAGRSPTCHRPATHSRQSPVSDWLVPGPTLSCNSSGTAIAILRACRAHRLARWHRFVSIEHREPLQTALQGTFSRAMICGKAAELPHKAVQGLCPPFLQFI